MASEKSSFTRVYLILYGFQVGQNSGLVRKELLSMSRGCTKQISYPLTPLISKITEQEALDNRL